ncbi:transcription antitermination factor NusB [Sulfobacillus harzensis]|uniref:Transcription antitermination protein NusB n=1 Tax=Sulfobacillus harzensis TaxID=2729629 RepID=A0A7Y0Q173_9FIRM|nr:transcription antitermination factor NusB [Sulfobacillus harzensis]
MARHHARELALKILFEYDLAQATLPRVLDRTLDGASETDRAYARQLVEGTVARQKTLDEWISAAARDWRIHRMPAIDRNILRLGAYEMAEEPDIPISVIIDEAVELAQAYSTDQAKKFVNGVLASIATQVRPEGDPDRPHS